MKKIVPSLVVGIVVGIILGLVAAWLDSGNPKDLAKVSNAQAVATASRTPTRMDEFEYYANVLRARYPDVDMSKDLEKGLDIAQNPLRMTSLNQWFGEADYKYRHQ